MNLQQASHAPDRILKVIRQSPRVPAPSQVVSKILSITRNPDCDYQAVAELIQCDSALTAELLRQTNNALYAGAKTTSSVKDACVRLGLKRVRAVVINDHIVSGMGKACPPGFQPNLYWQAALATSVAAKELARALDPTAIEDAATAGLLVDVGIGLLAYGAGAAYGEVLRQLSSCLSSNIEEMERRILGITHSEVAATVFADWKLDEHLIDAVRRHHLVTTKAECADAPRLSRIVGAAVTCSEIALGGSDMEIVERLFEQLDGLTPKPDELVGRLLDQLVVQIQQTAEDLSLELGETGQMASNFAQVAGCLPNVGVQLSHRPMSRSAFDRESL